MESTGFQASNLLQPFASGSSVGNNPRDDTSPSSPYSRLRDARSDARATERNADHDGISTGPHVHWRLVEENARLILTDVGKDLEVAAWLTEACVRLYGLPGFTFGAELMAGLVSLFWADGLFPAKEDDGSDPRAISLAGLNGISGDGTLMQPLRMIVLFHRADQTPITLWHYEQAEEVEGIGDAARKKRRLNAGVMSLGELDNEARLTGASHLRAIGDEAKRALTWWRTLTTTMDNVLTRDSPPSSRVTAVIEKIVRIAARLAPEPEDRRLTTAEEMESVVESELVPTGQTTDGEAAEQARPATVGREEMLHNLVIIADYFRTQEPHSPLAYALDEAVRRARLSFLDLLREVVPEFEARSTILAQLGIRPPQE